MYLLSDVDVHNVCARLLSLSPCNTTCVDVQRLSCACGCELEDQYRLEWFGFTCELHMEKLNTFEQLDSGMQARVQREKPVCVQNRSWHDFWSALVGAATTASAPPAVISTPNCRAAPTTSADPANSPHTQLHRYTFTFTQADAGTHGHG